MKAYCDELGALAGLFPTLTVFGACAPVPTPREDARADDVEAAINPDTSEPSERGYSPPWTVGQTWGVRHDHFLTVMTGGTGPRPMHDAWRYEVVDITDFGLVRIEARRFDSDGTLSTASWDRASFELHTSGMIVHDFNRWQSESDTMLPFLPYFSPYGARVPGLVPWWPSFPLVPGEESSYFDGALAQSVREEDGVLRVTVFAETMGGVHYSGQTMTMEWERGRPFWTRVEIVQRREDGTSETPYEIRGRTFSWDQGETWEHHRYDGRDASP